MLMQRTLCCLFVLSTIACQKKAAPPASEDAEANTPQAAAEPVSLVLYSGRSQSTVGPLLKQLRDTLEREHSIRLQIKYGKTAALAATLLEEQAAGGTRADLFFAQDAGALGLLEDKGLLSPLPDDVLKQVKPAFRSPRGAWVGVSGRARSVVYNTEKVKQGDLPSTLAGFTSKKWRGRVGWAPTNASFQAHVTALRIVNGNAATRAWLESMQRNDAKAFPKNTPIVEAVARGEIDVGLVNHYYLHKLQSKGVATNAKNTFLDGVGSIVNVAGLAVVDGSQQKEAALELVRALLATESQRYFAEKTFEYPLAQNVAAAPNLVALSSLRLPDLDLSRLSDLEGTLAMLRQARVLQ